MIVNKYNYGGGGSGSGVTPQEVQAQIDSALTPYWDSAATESAITQSVSGKADAANVTPRGDDGKGFWVPTWNGQGVITGESAYYFETAYKVNGWGIANVPMSQTGEFPDMYVPVSAGTAGELLVSSGPGNAPVWSAVTIPDVSEFWTSAETKDYVDGAVSGISLVGYYTSAQTDEKIASAVTPVANHLAEVEQITASAYTELHDDILELSARTMPDMSLYTPTSGFSTINGSAITNGGNIVIQGGGGDMSNYWNSAQTKSYVDSAATNLQDQIDTMDEVVADALNDLNGDLVAVSGVVHDFTYGQQPVVRTMLDLAVPSTPVNRIISLPQSSYDTLENDGLISPYTFYIIVNNS